MINEDTCVGEFADYDNTHVISVRRLRSEIRRGTHWDARQYCDRRYTTNLYRFSYDPFTGEWIDWKEVRKLLEQN